MIVNYKSKFEEIHKEFTDKHRELVEAGRLEEAKELHDEYWSAVDLLQSHRYPREYQFMILPKSLDDIRDAVLKLTVVEDE